jgi:predicted ATPase
MLGFPDRAREQAERGLSWSEAADNPMSLLNSEAFVASIYALLRDGLQAQVHAARTLTLCEEHHHPTFLPFGRALHGAAQAMQGHLDAGIDEMERAIADYYALDIQLWVPMMLVPLADAYGRRGQCAEGLAVLARKRSSSEHAWDAELKRVQGLLLSHEPSQMPTAVACLQDALRIARQQQARSLELRAATGLARIWSNGDKVREARELLEPVYNWFTEGFGTPDLIDARELLDAIG